MSARSRLGQSRRNIIKRKKRSNVISGIAETVGNVATFAAGQIDRADTAWGEYEAGYEGMGGDSANIEKPGFFKRTAQQLLPGGKTGLPEGDVEINGMMYDRKKLQGIGEFLKSDSAALLDEGAMESYKERMAPGREKVSSDNTKPKKKFSWPFSGKDKVNVAEGDETAYTALKNKKTTSGGGSGVKTPVFNVEKYANYGGGNYKENLHGGTAQKLNLMETLDGNRSRQSGKFQNLRSGDWLNDEWGGDGGGEKNWLTWWKNDDDDGGGKGGY